MNAFDEPLKPYRMPGTEYTITVKIFAGESNFPATGETGVYYFAGTLSDYEGGSGTLKYWNGSSYTAYLGPRPTKPPHNP